MKQWTPQQIAQAAGARLVSPPPAEDGPERVVIDSRQAGPGTLFVGLRGAHADGGTYATQALAASAWGILTTPEHAQNAACAAPGVLLAAEYPLKALQSLATAWRRHLKASVIGVTGSTGKTSTKDLLRAVLTPYRKTVASRANFNTEIGLPLEILSAPDGTEVLILEMGMRGAGQIAELAAIAEPDVGVIVSLGPVHLELLGSMEAIAAAKAELIAALPAHGTAVIPSREPLLDPHLRSDIQTVRFGDGGEVRLTRADEQHVEIDLDGTPIELEVQFAQAHLRRNLLAAAAAAQAVGVTPSGRIELALSPGRGQRRNLPGGVTLIDDCYNANPMSMRAALEDLAATAAGAEGSRRVAVLGDMLELGPDQRRYHVEVGEQAAALGIDHLITVGPLAEAIALGFDRPQATHRTANAAEAAAMAADLIEAGDVVLVKASRGVGLELVCSQLAAGVAV